MSEIFVSYAREDKNFALNLVESLAKHYDVWVDSQGIKGGMEWEQEIDAAIRGCEIFVAVVSPNSNLSTWVQREILHAERLNKYIVPVLVDGELPLRLLHLHYVDFRADYHGGLNDLLKVTKTVLTPQEANPNEVNTLVGEGIRAFLDDDYPIANNLIEQAALLDSELGRKLLSWWRKTTEEKVSRLSERLMSKISILETSKLSTIQQYSDSNTYEWSLELETDAATLEKVDHVKYLLHPTFSNRERIVRDRNTFFRLRAYGWGVFDIPIEIYFIDGTVGYTQHTLTFDSAHE